MALPTNQNQQQLIKRRIYSDTGELLREGYAPKDLPNDRTALLDYWAQADAAEAEAAAAAAEAEAAALAALEQEPASGEAMALPGLMAAVEQHATLIEALDQRTAGLEAAQPDEVLRAAAQLQLAAGAAQAVEATALRTTSQIEAVAAEAQARLDALAAEQAAGLAKVADAIEFARQQVTTTSASLVADGKRQLAQLITGVTARVADMRGPRGATGAVGAATTVGAGRPEGPSAMEPLLGRGAIRGDIYIDGADNDRRAYRWDGESSWEPGPAMATVQLRDVKVSALDHSTKVYPTVSTAVGGGSGGSGIVVPIAPSVITKNASVPFVDTSRFQAGGFDSFTSGIIMLELTPTTGTFAGNRSSLAGAFQLLAGTPDPFRYTEFANLGNLFNGTTPLVDVQFNGQLGLATAPGGLGISIPPGSKPATTLFVTITSGEPSHTTFLLRGDVIFNQDPAGTAVAANALMPKQPAWNMV